MTLAFVVPGLDEAASEKAIAILQNRLSQEQEAALVLKHAHWNVTGPNFIAVHEMLDPEVEAVMAAARVLVPAMIRFCAISAAPAKLPWGGAVNSASGRRYSQ